MFEPGKYIFIGNPDNLLSGGDEPTYFAIKLGEYLKEPVWLSINS